MIYEILDNQSPCKNKNHFKAPENDSKKEDEEVLFEHHGPTKRKFLGNSISSIYGGGVKVKLSAPSSPGAVLYGKERDTVPLEFFEQGDVAECYPDKLYTPFPQLATFEKLVCTTSTIQIAAEQARLSSPGSSDAPESPPLAFSEGLEDCVVQDSPERDSCIEAMGESKESGDSLFSCPENLTSIVSSHQDAELGKDCELLGDDVQATSVSLEAMPNSQRQKRMKLVPPKEQQCTWSKARGQ